MSPRGIVLAFVSGDLRGSFDVWCKDSGVLEIFRYAWKFSVSCRGGRWGMGTRSFQGIVSLILGCGILGFCCNKEFPDFQDCSISADCIHRKGRRLRGLRDLILFFAIFRRLAELW